MPTKDNVACPLCDNPTNAKHCTSPNCTWERCMRAGCNIDVDPRTGRYIPHNPLG